VTVNEAGERKADLAEKTEQDQANFALGERIDALLEDAEIGCAFGPI
jgi:hypothetical protein